MAEYDTAVASQIIDRLERELADMRGVALLAYGALATQNCAGAAEVCTIMRPVLWPDDSKTQEG